ncbi:nudix hydrolase 17, mitochondrial-like [Cynara cardunculus var. scolymus]|uniref:nudix hydrolase 17, mitochondrial-like n=1 Tax=Cynara cardunculus var. scolymus TaxID=59895 RepID=UPI000D626233|nr:nudix hydrolase 17, mitochondrial-like [Cynara cardunculus var. scolymus]
MVAEVVARSGRALQRYNCGQRIVVGCVPYRLKGGIKASSKNIEDVLEVLVISAQRKSKGMLFPKGGWELDESIQAAALRETIEEAGVSGAIESELGKWCFKSKGNDAYYEGHMFPLLVVEELDLWPEKNIRQRFWVSASKAKESCQYAWMREALDLLVTRLQSSPTKLEDMMN